MARPPLVLETWGKISRTRTSDGGWTASARYRDSDGVTRQMRRTGRTGAEAERTLIAALRDRLTPDDGEIGRDTTVRALFDAWWEEVDRDKDWAIGTVRRYRAVTGRILTGIGSLRVGEANVPRLDRFIKAVRQHHGDGEARIARVVLIGAFGLATRHGAVPVNPVLSTAPVPKKSEEVVALKPNEVLEVMALLQVRDEAALKGKRATDLAQVALFMAGTSGRIGEALGMQWDSWSAPEAHIHRTVALDADGRTVVQDVPKTASSRRRVTVPPIVAAMLEVRRREALGPLVFPSSTGTVRSPNNFRVQWNSALRGSAHQGVTPKAFRRALATYLRDHVTTEASSDQLGNSVLVLERFYLDRSSTVDNSAIIAGFLDPASA